MTSLRELLSAGRSQLAVNRLTEIDAEIILAHLLNINRNELLSFQGEITEPEIAALRHDFNVLLRERISGTPTQYLVGEAHFRYLTLAVGQGVLIPRPETELLVSAALIEIKRIFNKEGRRISVVDLGAGSGAIAISIAIEADRHEIPVTVVAVEKDATALSWLQQNVQKYEADVRVVHADVAEALMDVTCDVVIANPPYLPETIDLPQEVRKEPMVALIGGGDGSDTPKHFINAAYRILKPGGFLAIEHFESHGNALANFMSDRFNEIALHNDLANRPRWTSARRNEK